MSQLIYKILSQQEWKQAQERGSFVGSAIDMEDGFIHFSSAEQVQETAAKHFAGQENLLLVAVCETKLGDSVRWEESRGGQLFPHLYGELMVTLADDVWELPLDENGNHIFPDSISTS